MRGGGAAPPWEPGLRGLLRFARLEVGRPAATLASLTLAMACLEGVELLLLVPLLRLAGLDLGGGGLDPLAESVGGLLRAFGLEPTLGAVLAVFAAAGIGVALLGSVHASASARLQAGATARIRKRLYAAVSRARWTFLARRRSSDLALALTAEADRVASALHFAVEIGTGAVVAAVYLAMALRVSPALTAATAACAAFLLLAARRRLLAAREGGEEISLALAAWYGEMTEHLSSLRLHRAFGNADRAEERFDVLVDRVAAGGSGLSETHAGTRFRNEAVTTAALAVLVWVAVEVFSLGAGSLVLLLFLYGRLMRRAGGLQQQVQYMAGELPAWDAVARLEAECRAEGEERGPPPGAPLVLREGMRFEGVSFRWREEGPAALEGVTLEIPAARTTAVVGVSGAGKSTLVDLATGLLRPSAGRVLVDGAELDPARRAAWQAGIGAVPQDPFLFHDTVRANLLWAAPGAPEADLEEALRAADALDLVRSLPGGLDAVLGDRGSTLSGGERQRIALARALVRRPSLLVLDEATSSLDSESEERIRAALAALHGRATLLVVAHRLSTVRGADAVHVLEGGRLVESGSFEALLARPGGRLRALAAAQGILPPGAGP
ncbi:MAG: ABC transporter ATP-binding protein/permease [Planctomycetes bacterium]|nr:ABC transporter ATP-binding protein/permease [Planctomycetota bacterium]